VNPISITPDWLQWGFGGLLLLVLVGGFFLLRSWLSKTLEQAAQRDAAREVREAQMQEFLESMVKGATVERAEFSKAWQTMTEKSITAQEAGIAAQRENVAAIREVTESIRDHNAVVVQHLIELKAQKGA